MSISILLVDDNQTFLSAVRQFLQLLSDVQIVGEANDGRTALLLAAKLRPDLMLLDITLTTLSGLEVARAMQFWPHRPKVVFLSMHDSAAYREAAEGLGALGYVDKADFVVNLIPIIEQIIADKPHGSTENS